MESATSVVGSPIENPEMIVFDVNSLGERFRALTDKRHRRGIRYRLDLLLVLLVLYSTCRRALPRKQRKAMACN